MTTNYAGATLVIAVVLLLAAGGAAASRFGRSLAWQPRLLFSLVVGFAVIGLLVFGVTAGLSPAYVWWPSVAAVIAVAAVMGHWRGRSRQTLDIVEVPEPDEDDKPAPQQRHRPRLATPRALRREEPQP